MSTSTYQITSEHAERIERGALPPRTVYYSTGQSFNLIEEQNDGWMSVEFDARKGRRMNNFRRLKEQNGLNNLEHKNYDNYDNY